jgi:hypothetical protein
MAITSAICKSFKREMVEGIHDFTTDVFYLALYSSSATLDADTTAYSATNEITGTGYVAGGQALTTVAPVVSGAKALVDFADESWTGATFTANGGVIYNSSKANRAVCTVAFGIDKTVAAGTFTVIFPTPDATNAMIRIN